MVNYEGLCPPPTNKPLKYTTDRDVELPLRHAIPYFDVTPQSKQRIELIYYIEAEKKPHVE